MIRVAEIEPVGHADAGRAPIAIATNAADTMLRSCVAVEQNVEPSATTPGCSATIWMESSDNQDGHFGGRGEVMIVAARR